MSGAGGKPCRDVSKALQVAGEVVVGAVAVGVSANHPFIKHKEGMQSLHTQLTSQTKLTVQGRFH